MKNSDGIINKATSKSTNSHQQPAKTPLLFSANVEPRNKHEHVVKRYKNPNFLLAKIWK